MKSCRRGEMSKRWELQMRSLIALVVAALLLATSGIGYADEVTPLSVMLNAADAARQGVADERKHCEKPLHNTSEQCHADFDKYYGMLGEFVANQILYLRALERKDRGAERYRANALAWKAKSLRHIDQVLSPLYYPDDQKVGEAKGDVKTN